VIQGWNQGLVGAKVGGRRLLVIPASLGYGQQGRMPDIAPGETLVFVVDVVSINGK
jgi:peptidylprolyl isomerase